MKARLIQAVAEASRDMACMSWRSIDAVVRALGRVQCAAYRALNTTPTAIDPDRMNCRECGEMRQGDSTVTALRVYAAGASAEVDMVAGYIGRLRDAGAVITYDWTPSVRDGSGAADAGMSAGLRMSCVSDDLAGIAAADLVWLLAPEATTIGAWVELGYARGLGIPVHVSGPRNRCTIFTEFCVHHETHEAAFVILSQRARWARGDLS